MTLTIIWQFIKKYWELLIAALGALAVGAWYVIMVVLTGGTHAVKPPIVDPKDPTKNIDQHDKEIEDAKKKQEQEAHDADVAYLAKIAEIQKKYDEQQKVLDEEQKRQVRQIMDETKGDPAELTRRLADLTGIEVVK